GPAHPRADGRGQRAPAGRPVRPGRAGARRRGPADRAERPGSAGAPDGRPGVQAPRRPVRPRGARRTGAPPPARRGAGPARAGDRRARPSRRIERSAPVKERSSAGKALGKARSRARPDRHVYRVTVERLSPTLSVIVHVRGGERRLAECLASLGAQTLPAIEVILTGRPPAVPLPDERFTVVAADAGDAGAARNLGVARARGRYLAFADGDAAVPPDAFERLVRTLEATG